MTSVGGKMRFLAGASRLLAAKKMPIFPSSYEQIPGFVRGSCGLSLKLIFATSRVAGRQVLGNEELARFLGRVSLLG